MRSSLFSKNDQDVFRCPEFDVKSENEQVPRLDRVHIGRSGQFIVVIC